MNEHDELVIAAAVAQVSVVRSERFPSASPYTTLRLAALTILFITRMRRLLKKVRRRNLCKSRSALISRVNFVITANRLKKPVRPKKGGLSLGGSAKLVLFLVKLRRLFKRHILERHPAKLQQRVDSISHQIRAKKQTKPKAFKRIKVASVIILFIVRLLGRTRVKYPLIRAREACVKSLSLGTIARLKMRVRRVNILNRNKRHTYLGSAVKAVLFVVKMRPILERIRSAATRGEEGRLALVRTADSSLDGLIHRHIGRYRAMLRDVGDGRLQEHLNSVISVLEKHVKIELDEPQLGSLHETYARMMGVRKVGGELILNLNGIYVMLKDLGVNKYLISKEEVSNIYKFAAQNEKGLSRKQFCTFMLNVARVSLSRPPHNVPLGECLEVFMAKFLPKRATVLKPVKPKPQVKPKVDQSIFSLTADQPTMQHFSPLLLPMAGMSRDTLRSLLRPVNASRSRL